MFLTLINCAKKAKSKHILVSCASLVSGHRVNRIRERLGDKLEFLYFDPYVQEKVVYRELKKLRSIDFIKDKRYEKLGHIN
ncbi:39S ribosomal protein L33, mitochondrial [Chelonus insularis]|uniref:39S ribosomal protein L33, mitochondrial n=1 Tax=Chelonus insularis TaxID=460826 RepID=UPI00158F470B|nr:39S ribosomal protein L33, mitochondrial [Chelonus insularis]